jgi:leader peptidase (prepilin peptidase)/N-methyltransferase
MVHHAIYIAFAFALGACVGSFLNVVVWRLPRVEHKEGEGLLRSFYRSWQALSWPPSQCPGCGSRLKWYDNVPVIGWLKLGGRCRSCAMAISPRYPIVEAVTGGIFVFYYVAFFILQVGPCPPVPGAAPAGLLVPRDLWVYLLYMALLSGLLAASLIDAELFIIPLEIPYVLAVVGFVVHAIFDRPTLPGALNLVDPATGAPTVAGALAAGGALGLAVSLVLFRKGIIPISFPNGEPILEVDRPDLEEEIREAKAKGEAVPDLPPPYTKRDIRAEIRKEIRFLMPPMTGAVLWLLLTQVGPIGRAWAAATASPHVNGLLGAVLGALVGAWLVWVVRILGTLGFGRVAMGLGDVHLMFGVGAVVGAGPVVVAFFLAPFFGILLAVYLLLTGNKRELPYGPYLSLGTAAVMLFYCPIADHFRPGLEAAAYFLTGRGA